ncbi:MAG: mycoredoxin [Lentisphaeria bacterium]
MKKLIVIFLALLIYQKWGVIDNYINPPPDYAESHGGKVILYATQWCGYCKKARSLLNDNNIPFYEYDIEKSQEGAKQHKNLGGKGIPLLLINGEVIKGYNPSRMLELANKK